MELLYNIAKYVFFGFCSDNGVIEFAIPLYIFCYFNCKKYML